jgi:hypothetical protein
VQKVVAGNDGRFTISLEAQHKLEVVPDNSKKSEHWRFFKPYAEESHRVYSGDGFQRE